MKINKNKICLLWEEASCKLQVAATLNSNNNNNDEKDSHFSNFNRNRHFLEQLRGELVQDFTAMGKVFCLLIVI